jgi:hypothetical protein
MKAAWFGPFRMKDCSLFFRSAAAAEAFSRNLPWNILAKYPRRARRNRTAHA